jgi:hypothetical protein
MVCTNFTSVCLPLRSSMTIHKTRSSIVTIVMYDVKLCNSALNSAEGRRCERACTHAHLAKIRAYMLLHSNSFIQRIVHTNFVKIQHLPFHSAKWMYKISSRNAIRQCSFRVTPETLHALQDLGLHGSNATHKLHCTHTNL